MKIYVTKIELKYSGTRAHSGYSTTRLDVDDRKDTRAATGDDINY